MLDIHKKKNIYKKIFYNFFVSFLRRLEHKKVTNREHSKQYEQMFNGEHANACSEKHMFG